MLEPDTERATTFGGATATRIVEHGDRAVVVARDVAARRERVSERDTRG